ncbi:hypothetical protein SpCBS45565_g07287 [Spizellomyces sp. 'palustris']|nr:hypothetical protein SpCBS45565_g07287 [Spizellomyces sp. 'palustris']
MSDVRRLLKQARAARSSPSTTPSSLRKQTRKAATVASRSTVKSANEPSPKAPAAKPDKVVVGYGSDSQDDSKEIEAPQSRKRRRKEPEPSEAPESANDALPADFFDKTPAAAIPSSPPRSSNEPSLPTSAESSLQAPLSTLPSNFFDTNPAQAAREAAKRREDQLAKEYDLFKKEIEQDVMAADQVAEVEEEEEDIGKDEERRMEQETFVSRLAALRKQREEMIISESQSKNAVNGSGRLQTSVQTSGVRMSTQVQKAFEDEDMEYAYEDEDDEESE